MNIQTTGQKKKNRIVTTKANRKSENKIIIESIINVQTIRIQFKTEQNTEQKRTDQNRTKRNGSGQHARLANPFYLQNNNTNNNNKQKQKINSKSLCLRL